VDATSAWSLRDPAQGTRLLPVRSVLYNPCMATRRFEIEDLVNRPGTYFNPQTEVLVIVDDSPELDTEVFDMEDSEGADWILVSEELPVDETVRDELLERFQARHASPGADPLGDPVEAEEEFDGFEVEDPDES
jgi:hypothetical protein